MELIAKINDGKITLPEEYSFLNNKTVKILLVDESDSVSQTEIMKSILKEIIKRNVFGKIQNPVDWQRSLRNEWE